MPPLDTGSHLIDSVNRAIKASPELDLSKWVDIGMPAIAVLLALRWFVLPVVKMAMDRKHLREESEGVKEVHRQTEILLEMKEELRKISDRLLQMTK